MNLCVRIVFISLWLLLTSALPAQIGLSLPFVNNISPNATVNYPVKVTGWDSIAGAQFIIRWDPQVLQYENVFLPFSNPLSMTTGDFGTTQAQDSGILRVQWEADFILAGETVPDETTIFTLQLKAIGAINSGTPVYFTQDFITPFDIVQANSDSSLTSYNINQVNLTQGFGAIGYTVSTDEHSGGGHIPLSIFPNPFSEKTRVVFDLKTPSDVLLTVTDAAGRTLFEKTMPQLRAGQHGTEIASPLMRERGTYFLILRAGAHSCTRPLIVF